jgi:3-oxoacyl-[acyl-carrier protein] reductase
MRKALVTGGSRGIGKAISAKFEEHGYEVIMPTRQELDLSESDSIASYIEKNKDVYFDVIVNNAGINDINDITDILDEEIDDMMTVNLIAPIKLLRGFVKNMKKNQYGRIVNIGSIWAVVSKKGRCVYSATKNGIHGVTNALAVELAPYNILINTVCPGFTLTELTRKNNTEEEMKEISADIPIGRMAAPEEIAEVVYFLCSEQNTYLTGQKIAVDGGFAEK